MPDATLTAEEIAEGRGFLARMRARLGEAKASAAAIRSLADE